LRFLSRKKRLLLVMTAVSSLGRHSDVPAT
jgi:hypothetical protein